MSFFSPWLNFSFNIADPQDLEIDFTINECKKVIHKIIPLKKTIHHNKFLKKLKKILEIDLSKANTILETLIHQDFIIKNEDQNLSLNIFSNPTRQQIFTLIKENPGIYLYKLKQKLNLGTNQLLYHLSALLEFQKIKFTKFYKIRAFGCIEIPDTEIILGFYLSRDPIRDILRLLIFPKCCLTLTQIKNHLEHIALSTIKYNLQMLKKYHLIQLILKNEQKMYQIPSKYQIMIRNSLAYIDNEID